MHKIEVIPVVIKGREGYDIQINDRDANVQDYIDALDRFIDAADCYRSRQHQLKACKGCFLCCQERIPLTAIDALKLTKEALRQTFSEVMHVYVEGKVVDITMSLDDQGRCKFLDNATGFCGNYHDRPLVCHTFICCPSSLRAQKLREEVVNAGEDELVRMWFHCKSQGTRIIHEGVDPKPNIRDYPVTPFTGAKNYNQVKLKDICSTRLWASLIS